MERVAQRVSQGQRELLTLHEKSGEIAGTMMLEGGMVHFGVQLLGQISLDEIFWRDNPRLAETIQRIVDREALARAGQELSLPLSPSQHAGLCGLTARALRRLSATQRHGAETVSKVESGWPLLGLLNITFSPLELMLAAGRQGPIEYTDPAVCFYGAPPGQPAERWLFEWQQASDPQPWPILTTRLFQKPVSAVAALGALGQRLLRVGANRDKHTTSSKRRAVLLHLEQGTCLLVSTDRYATLLLYSGTQLDRLLCGFEDVLSQLLETTPEPSASAAAPLALAAPPPPIEAPSNLEHLDLTNGRWGAESLGNERTAEVAISAVDFDSVLWERSPDAELPILSLRGLNVQLGGRYVLSSLSCDIAKVGAYLLQAPEGGEKRLLVRALCGPRPAQMLLSGSAQYQGQSLAQPEGPVTPQSSAQLLMMTVCDYLLSNLVERGTLLRPALIEKAKELLVCQGLSSLIDRFAELVAHIDVTERRMLEIVRAAATKPALLVLDEPLAGIPAAGLPRLLALLNLQAQQRALLIFAEQVEALLALSPRIGGFTAGGFFVLSDAAVRPVPETAPSRPVAAADLLAD